MTTADPIIRAGRVEIGEDVAFGDNVVIEADEVIIGAGSRIGMSEADDFRTPPGLRITARRFSAGERVKIGRAGRIEGGDVRLHDEVRIVREATLRVLDLLEIGTHGTVGEGSEISGRNVQIGQELWMLPGAKIGGGSAFETQSRLEAGHYLHLGVDTLVNTARPVILGHEVGLGTRTSIYTHGAYPSRLMGFPVAFAGVEIGDFTWVPGAIINPGVRIGRNCVIGVNSLVTRSIPDGALAGGSPAAVIRERAYPSRLTGERLRDFWLGFLGQYAALLGSDVTPQANPGGGVVTLATPATTFAAIWDPEAWDRAGRTSPGDAARCLVVGPGTLPDGGRAGWTGYDTAARRIAGLADGSSERLSNELRRHGIRFYSRAAGARYHDWDVQVPDFGEPAG